MQILEPNISDEQMITILPYHTRHLHTYESLQLFSRLTVQFHEVGQHAQHGGFLLGFFWQTVDEFDYFFDVWINVVCDQEFAVSEDFRYQLPAVNSVFDVFDEVFEVIYQDKLVLFVVSDKFY